MTNSTDPVNKSAASFLSREDYIAIREVLIAWREDGVANPLLPSNVDINGDGKTDSYGLDAFDNVIFVTSVKLEDTVYVSDGDDMIDHELVEA
jgi:hypothetical protein